jgi:hypothetical protein
MSEFKDNKNLVARIGTEVLGLFQFRSLAKFPYNSCLFRGFISPSIRCHDGFGWRKMNALRTKIGYI